LRPTFFYFLPISDFGPFSLFDFWLNIFFFPPSLSPRCLVALLFTPPPGSPGTTPAFRKLAQCASPLFWFPDLPSCETLSSGSRASFFFFSTHPPPFKRGFPPAAPPNIGLFLTPPLYAFRVNTLPLTPYSPIVCFRSGPFIPYLIPPPKTVSDAPFFRPSFSMDLDLVRFLFFLFQFV